MENKNINSNEKNDESKEKTALPKKKKKGGKGKRVVAIVLAVALIGSGTVWYLNNGRNSVASADDVSITEYTVGRNDISVTLTGTGTLEPADSYTVTTLIEGEILEDTFEEGDLVTEDSVLYVVDNSDAETNLEKAELTLSQSQSSHNRLLESLDDLDIRANDEGTVTKVYVEYGDEVKAGESIATIRNSSVMTMSVPFISIDVDDFYIGQVVDVTIDSTYETIQGQISEIIDVEEVIDGNKLVKYVTIDVQNPGGISTDDSATATVNGIASVEGGLMEYKYEETITSKIAGDVVAVHVTEGNWASEDQILVVLDSDTLEESIESSESKLQDAELSLENLQDKVEEYTIQSPISGTVITKSYKSGDTVEQGKTLCTIYDLSYMTMTLNVDELDITKVEVGQAVQVSAEAAGNQVYTGEVTKISISGSTQSGATTYPVTIQIDEIDGLLPGMNVDATIVIENREDVISIPVNALSRGNMVLVKSDGTTTEETGTTDVEDTESTSTNENAQGAETGTGERTEGAQRPSGTQDEADSSATTGTEEQTNTSAARGQNSDMKNEMVANVESPVEGYEYRVVEVGVSDENNIEVLSGLSEGDQIAIVGQVITVDEDGMMMPGMMMPGVSGGGTQGGGMQGGGGMPSGGGRQ